MTKYKTISIPLISVQIITVIRIQIIAEWSNSQLTKITADFFIFIIRVYPNLFFRNKQRMQIEARC